MRVSRIHIQQTLLMLNNKKSTEDVEKQLENRCISTINQVSIFNSTFDIPNLPKIAGGVQVLIVRKCKMDFSGAIQIFGGTLKTVELPYCFLKQFPVIHSECLQKLNVSNNQISQILSIPNKSLKLLDIRNNKISKITRQIHNASTIILHQFITKKHEKSLLSLPICLYPLIIDMQNIVNEAINNWSKSQLIETCEHIIQNDNDILLHQLLPHLSEEFINKIFQISKIKRKHNIIQLLVSQQQNLHLSNTDALQLLMPKYILKDQLYKANLCSLIKSFSNFNNEKERVFSFLNYIDSIQSGKNFFIQSQKDLINFMTLNVSFPNIYEADFLMTQSTFFCQYDFSNKSILQYLLQFDNLRLLQRLINFPIFRDKLFALGHYKKLLKPSKKIYKYLLKQEKSFQKALKHKNDLYFPQYRQRKSFCLKNDLYDYQILSEYEQMQCSYSHKDLKFTFKFCNKENEISIAKRIQTQLKRQKLKNMQTEKNYHSRTTSTHNF